MKRAYFIILILLTGCAQFNTNLTGGPRDETAPQIDSAKTIPYNGQLNFKGDVLTFKFDEYIKLNNPKENIIVTPQLSTDPVIWQKNKKMTITFQETLTENTTYVVTFNHAIQDITEKNDSVFQFVFSTGNYIDSLSLKGKVIDGFTNNPESNFLVGLYPVSLDATFDSIPNKFKPHYIAQTDKAGKFELNYLKEGMYYLFTYEDKNKNLFLDPDEKRGFLLEQTVLVNQNINGVELKVFQEENAICDIEKVEFTFPGQLKMITSSSLDSCDISITSDVALEQENTGSRDSLIFWLPSPPTARMKFYTNISGVLDTIRPIYKNVPEKGDEHKLKIEHNVKTGKINPGQNLTLTFSEPVKSYDLNKLTFFDKDSNLIQLEPQIKNLRSLEFPTFDTNAVRMVIDSNAVTSFFGTTYLEQKELKFEHLDSTYFGTLLINVDSVFNEPVIVHVLDDKGVVLDTLNYQEQMKVEHLPPGNYSLRLIVDSDNDGKWTAGSLPEGRLPEQVIYFNESIQIKSNWDKEIDWFLNGIPEVE